MQLLGEVRKSYGDFNFSIGYSLVIGGEVLLVESHGGGDGVGDPVEHHITEQSVPADGMTRPQAAVLSVPPGGVCPGGELLQDVGGQAQGGAAQANAHSVRLGALQ